MNFCAPTSVPRRGLDDGVPQLEVAIPLRVLHHPQSDAVLDATTGVEELALGH